MLPDYHIHTPLCRHAEGEPEAYFESAKIKNIPEMCFTDHVPNPDNYDPEHRMTRDEFALYRDKIRAVAAMSGNERGPRVLLGVEADYYEGCEKFLREWLPRQDLDIVIGSIHYIRNWGFDNPDEREVWDNVDVTESWRSYFELMGRLADTKLFDLAGHFDLPKKFGYFPPEKEMKAMILPVLDKVARAEMAIELNTSGLRKPVREIYPGLMILEAARERGIPICFGSDAHMPEEVGYEFTTALAWARKAGYKEAVRFAGRRKKPYALPSV